MAGTHQVAFSLADTAADAVNGTASFAEKQPIAALTRLYPNYTQVIARTDAGINSIADMRGKRVSTGAPNSGTEVIANRMLEAAGLDPAKDIQAQRTELGKTVEGMKDGSIDAMFWSGGLPTGGITDLFVSRRDGRQVPRRDRHAAEAAGDQLRSTSAASSRPAPIRHRRTCRPSSCRMCFWSKTIWTETPPAC